jgi:hypothetical protein
LCLPQSGGQGDIKRYPQKQIDHKLVSYQHLILGGMSMAVTVQKLSRALMRRSMRILDMQYKLSEIANELGADKEQILQLILAGAPARKDSRGHFWIHGTTFVQWLHDVAPKNDRDKNTFSDNECWCMGCRSMVVYLESRRRGLVSYGKCPAGHSVTRFLSQKSAKRQ